MLRKTLVAGPTATPTILLLPTNACCLLGLELAGMEMRASLEVTCRRLQEYVFSIRLLHGRGAQRSINWVPKRLQLQEMLVSNAIS